MQRGRRTERSSGTRLRRGEERETREGWVVRSCLVGVMRLGTERTGDAACLAFLSPFAAWSWLLGRGRRGRLKLLP